jgi:prevent-host-death family protein
MITSAKELRTRTKAVLDTVARGQEVVVTHRGRACARIIQAGNKDLRGRGKRRSDVDLFGIWRDYRKGDSVSAQVNKLRKSRF